MHDLKFIRENPALFDKGMVRRGLHPQSARILALDEKRRAVQTQMQTLQARRNSTSKQIGMLKSQGKQDDAQSMVDAVSAMKQALSDMQDTQRRIADDLQTLLSELPNLLYDDVPDGQNEDDNVVMHTIGDIPSFDFPPKQHWELGENLGVMDFAYSAKISGARFVTLNGALARMERALGNFMIDMHTQQHGYTEYQIPVLVRSKAMYGTGQLPKFAEEAFKTTGDHYLISTSEIPLTNYAFDKILDAAELPKRLTAWSVCFRSEAGAAGKDTRGMLRQHQFYKVEMVSITTPEQSDAELERMLGCAENVLKALQIPYRVVKLCSGDMGFASRRTYDIEAWLPGQNTYREISSCSTCGDFQARRMQGRLRRKGQQGTEFVHTLNGSGLATGRTLIAIMENYQNADGTITVPEVLRPYMGGLKTLDK